MNLMKALLETYNYALNNNLVDKHKLSNTGNVLLPLYHSNRRSSGEDIFEIEIDEDSNAIGGSFLEKEEIIVFPITEDSITRSGSKIAPHAICDELSYLSDKIDTDKNNEYLNGINKLMEYEKTCINKNFKIIGSYILKNRILDDFLKYLLGGEKYTIDEKFKLSYEIIDGNNKSRVKAIDLNKTFITFKIQKMKEEDIRLTRDNKLHEFYISYVRDINQDKENVKYCNITGEYDYTIENHRGIIGNSKLVSVSNHKETYYGRFKKKDDVYSISYESSQKVHNMLKYLLDNKSHRNFIGENTYVINWLSNDIEKGGFDVVNDFDDEDDFDEIEDVTMEKIGGRLSSHLGNYFSGQDNEFDDSGDFYVLIIEKINNGRISVKYFRKLTKSEAYKRVKSWYATTRWNFYGKIKSPSLYDIVNFIYGLENNKGYLSCENKKLMRSTIERLIPCIIDSKKLPTDILRTTFYKLSNKLSYKNSWDKALGVGCSIIKKYKNDYENYHIDADHISEVRELIESRSFYYGKLMAIYEKLELDAKGQASKVTNSDRLWNSMIRTPKRTRSILELKIRPYINILKKNNIGGYIFYEKLITNINSELIKLDELNSDGRKSLNENFILGYYQQKKEFYTKKNNDKE